MAVPYLSLHLDVVHRRELSGEETFRVNAEVIRVYTHPSFFLSSAARNLTPPASPAGELAPSSVDDESDEEVGSALDSPAVGRSA